MNIKQFVLPDDMSLGLDSILGCHLPFGRLYSHLQRYHAVRKGACSPTMADSREAGITHTRLRDSVWLVRLQDEASEQSQSSKLCWRPFTVPNYYLGDTKFSFYHTRTLTYTFLQHARRHIGNCGNENLKHITIVRCKAGRGRVYVSLFPPP